MGSSEIVPNHRSTNTKSKLEDYDIVKRQSEGKVLMKNRRRNAFVLAIQHTFSDENQLSEYTKRSKTSLSVSHQFYLNAFDYEIISQSTICSRQYKLIEFFDYQPHTLKDQIQNRIATRKSFTNQQVMSILCSCVLVMSHFSRNETVHYTLNPSDIIIDNEGICKVVSSCLSDYVFDFIEKKDFYYAPETLKMFKHQSTTNGLTNKSAVFTLGVTLINMITLQDMTHLYNYGTHTINGELLQSQLKNIADVQLHTILTKMLKIHSYERITFTELEEMLFEMITRTENDKSRGKEREEDVDVYQIAKLEESIVKIKSQDQSRALENTENTLKSSMTKRQTNSINYLDKDEEDNPQGDKDHFLLTCQDQVVFDQFEQPIGQDLSESVMDKHSQLPLTIVAHQQKPSGKILTENSNISNGLVTYRQFSSSYNNCQQTQKENVKHKSKYPEVKKSCQQQYPEYVSEKFEEGQYEGYKLGGCRHGFGSFYYEEGGKYCGEWVQNKMEGKGVLYYSSGKIAYEGEWKQDRLHGYGVLYNENITVFDQQFDFGHLQLLDGEWIKYAGYFQDDVKKGQGTLFLSNGETFQGSFQNDQPHGMGQFRNVRGEMIKGCWLMGALNILS